MSRVDGKAFIFIVGAPRSGTTWLYRMLQTHSRVAAIQQELTVFTYLRFWDAHFHKEKQHIDNGDWRQGAPLLYTEDEFHQGMRTIAEDAYSRVLGQNPTATHIMDKHPAYAMALPLINKLFPRSKIIHIIRDGREVVVSMMSAKRRIGFGEEEIRGASRMWVRNIKEARRHSGLFGPERYMEVRYDELKHHTATSLVQLFDFAGLDNDLQLADGIAKANDIRVKQVSRGDKELNALRDKPDAIWKKKLSLEERWILDRMAGSLLSELGYAQPGWWKLHPMDPVKMQLRIARSRLLNTVGSAWHTWNQPFAEQLT